MAQGRITDAARQVALRDIALEREGLLDRVNEARLQNIIEMEAANEEFMRNRRTVADLAPMAGGILAGVAAAPFTGGLSLPAALAVTGGAGAIGGGVGGAVREAFDADPNFDLGNVLEEAAISGTINAATLRSRKTAQEEQPHD